MACHNVCVGHDTQHLGLQRTQSRKKHTLEQSRVLDMHSSNQLEQLVFGEMSVPVPYYSRPAL